MHERILLADVTPGVLRRLVDRFSEKGFLVEPLAADLVGEHALDLCEEATDTPDALLLELPHAEARLGALLDAALRHPAGPLVILLCAEGSTAGVAALKLGADDFLVAPLDLEELEIKLERALERRTLRSEVRRLYGTERRGRASVRLTGISPQIRHVRRQLERAAAGRATVLITGETGTGKELVATAIHELSPRRRARFVKVNCAALPDTLLESELFGHERGAFTGADQRRVGRFENADGGTLLLDEIGDMHLRTQAKVLRVLQAQEFERLGGTRPIRVDVRILAATNQDLAALIAHGSFREDLFFRLHVVSIALPPLRDRAEDIPHLAMEFLREFNADLARPRRGFSPAAMEALVGHAWPGNIRELRNAVERAVLMGESAWIEPGDLGLRPGAPEPRGAEAELVRLPEGGVDYREVERALLLQALEQSGWVQKDAARLLRMSRRKLNYRIQRLGITHPTWRRNRGPAPARSGEG